jgi:hypothetical protein
MQFQTTTRFARAISPNQDSTQNTFKLCPIHIAKLENSGFSLDFLVSAWEIRTAERCFGAIQHQNKRAATSVLVSVSELEKASRIPLLCE